EFFCEYTPSYNETNDRLVMKVFSFSSGIRHSETLTANNNDVNKLYTKKELWNMHHGERTMIVCMRGKFVKKFSVDYANYDAIF
ncbi:MAG: hypothetical protein KDH96_11045, partial [Candidatus Riesia sp.]|nr:hypothetical protein [Candidatus Riesia sp.]